MNTVLTFLHENWNRLQLEHLGNPSQLSCVMVTPRFKASSHLLFFILGEKARAPILVVKVPRIVGDNDRLNREVQNLNFVHSSRPAGFDSIPRVVAYEDYQQNRLLVETALVNQTMRPSVVRKQPEACLEAVLDWLIDLHQTTLRRDNDNANGFGRLVNAPLDYFEAAFPSLEGEIKLEAETREMANKLPGEEMPLVFEHGDLSSPNILMGKKKEIGVVDWELAEPRGLPVVDLFFFLTYIAFARKNARKNSECLDAFQDAFFGPEAWAIPHIVRYREALQISHRVLKPLFVLCWSRYVTSLVARLHDQDGSGGKLSRETADWLRKNRYYALWQHSLQHLDEIAFA